MSAEIDDLMACSVELAEQFLLQAKSTVIGGNANAHIESPPIPPPSGYATPQRGKRSHRPPVAPSSWARSRRPECLPLTQDQRSAMPLPHSPRERTGWHLPP